MCVLTFTHTHTHTHTHIYREREINFKVLWFRDCGHIFFFSTAQNIEKCLDLDRVLYLITSCEKNSRGKQQQWK